MSKRERESSRERECAQRKEQRAQSCCLGFEEGVKRSKARVGRNRKGTTQVGVCPVVPAQQKKAFQEGGEKAQERWGKEEACN